MSREWQATIITLVVGVVLVFGLPLTVQMFTLLNLTVYAAMALLGLSLGLIWGFGGILCFGQSAFFGLGAYAYAVTMINLGDSTVSVLLSILVPAAFAALLGYVLFYGRLSDVYLGVITLTVTLILFKLVNSTAGDQFVIGEARLGGYNGIPGIPTLNVPGDPASVLLPDRLYQVTVALVLGVYIALRWLLASHFGRVVVAIRENEQRAELLGYDVRLYKLVLFSIGAGVAGLAGCLFANWGAFVSPTVFSLAQSAQIIIYVIVGGLGTLVGPMLGGVLVHYLTGWLGTQTLVNNSLVMGLILVVFVLLVPRGLVPGLGALGRRLRFGGGRVDVAALREPSPPTPLPRAGEGSKG